MANTKITLIGPSILLGIAIYFIWLLGPVAGLLLMIVCAVIGLNWKP